MRACVMRGGRLVVDDTADPRPETGQMLVRILACGICGSDLHFLRHGEAMVAMTDAMLPSMGSQAMGMAPIDLSRDIVMGHEFCAEVVELGPETTGPGPGRGWCRCRCCSLPPDCTSWRTTTTIPVATPQYMLLSAPLALESPTASTSVRRADRAAGGGHPRRGPIGGHGARQRRGGGMRARGVGGHRRVARRRRGVDRGGRPVAQTSGDGTGHGGDRSGGPDEEGVVDAWRHVDGRRPLVAFEAVGVPGMLQQLMPTSPPAHGWRWSGCAWSPTASSPSSPSPRSCRCISRWPTAPTNSPARCEPWPKGQVDVSSMITGTVDLDGVPGAFEALAHPDDHVKILVEPAAT